eukprot:UC1_evm1s1968
MNTKSTERNFGATCYVGGLDERVTPGLLWELFLQVGPVVSVRVPKDRITGVYQNYGFVEFLSEDDAEYACKVMQMLTLYGKPIRVNKSSAHNSAGGKTEENVGANLYVGNLDPEVDEKLLFDTFSAFGVVLSHPKIMRDADTGASKGFAFVKYASFEASDAAIEAMQGQYLCNRPLRVHYAYKKDGEGHERHGTAAERLLAAKNPLLKSDKPNQMFAERAAVTAATDPEAA